MPLDIINHEAFAKHIENQVKTGMSYMDAIIDFCEKRDIDIEEIVPFITDKMKGELQREGRALHMLDPKKLDDPLPFDLCEKNLTSGHLRK